MIYERGTSNHVVIIMCIFYDNCNGVPRTFRLFLEIFFLFAVYPSILEWVGTLVCFIESYHAFKI